MDNYFTVLGIFFCLVGGCFAAEYVTVGNDQTVKPSAAGAAVDVTLTCTGSRSDLSYYIKNRFKWTFVQDGHSAVEISLGFYLNTKFADEKKYSISYDTVAAGGTGYFYNLKIKGVTHADNGVYQCSLLNEANTVTDAKSVTLTVVNPVESLSFELYLLDHKIGESSAPVTVDMTPYTISPGQYMVKCTAAGSNPAPILNLYHNEDKPYVVAETQQNPADGRMHYTGSFSFNSLVLNARSSPQILACTANIPGEFFPTKTAEISVLVQVDKPHVECENATASQGDRMRKITCRVTAKNANDALDCGKTSWLLGNRNQVIENGQRWKDTTGDYDILEDKCEKSDDEGLKVELKLYTVKDSLFKETYFIVYGVGANAHRHSVVLYDVTVHGSAAVVAMSLLGCLVMAALTNHLANL